MNNFTYTLISYNPGEMSYMNRCGDFIEGKPGNCNIFFYTNRNELIEKLSKELFEARKGSNEVTLLINGVDVYNLDCLNTENKDLINQIEDEFTNIENECDICLKKLEEQQIELNRLAKEKEEEMKKMKILREKQIIESAEKAELARLLSKYGRQ